MERQKRTSLGKRINYPGMKRCQLAQCANWDNNCTAKATAVPSTLSSPIFMEASVVCERIDDASFSHSSSKTSFPSDLAQDGSNVGGGVDLPPIVTIVNTNIPEPRSNVSNNPDTLHGNQNLQLWFDEMKNFMLKMEERLRDDISKSTRKLTRLIKKSGAANQRLPCQSSFKSPRDSPPKPPKSPTRTTQCELKMEFNLPLKPGTVEWDKLEAKLDSDISLKKTFMNMLEKYARTERYKKLDVAQSTIVRDYLNFICSNKQACLDINFSGKGDKFAFGTSNIAAIIFDLAMKHDDRFTKDLFDEKFKKWLHTGHQANARSSKVTADPLSTENFHEPIVTMELPVTHVNMGAIVSSSGEETSSTFVEFDNLKMILAENNQNPTEEEFQCLLGSV